MGDYLLGLDAGNTVIKAVIFDLEGRELAHAAREGHSRMPKPGYVERDLGSAQVIAEGFDPDLVARVIGLVDRAEYKRRQYPPGPKISRRNFGRDRRVPITNGFRERL